MNKDVIYIEPEDDITDIITKIENAKEKIVALVPPKKANVFRSLVNIKLIHKAGFTADKTIVLVTTDPAIMKLAAAVKVPVTKNLQTAPAVPDINALAEEKVATEEVVQTDEEGKEVTEEEAEVIEEDAVEEDSDTPEEAEDDAGEADESEKSEKAEEKPAETDEKSEKSGKKAKKPEKLSNNPVVRFVQLHKKATIGGSIGAVILILILVWAFAIAPAVTVAIKIRTTSSPFSESVSFVKELKDENATEGKFYLEEKKLENKTEVSFTATGTKNIGEKASGSVIIYAFFKGEGSISINAGTTFTNSGLSYTADKAVTLSYSGGSFDPCDNVGNPSSIMNSGCQITARVTVTAVEAGEKYNLAAANSGWRTTADVGVYSDAAMTGGTDNIVTIVSKEDVEKALTEVKNTSEALNKEKLIDSIGEDKVLIESSFRHITSDPTTTPAVGEQVKEGEKATLTVTTTDTMYVIDQAAAKTFIEAKVDSKINTTEEKTQKVYSITNPFIESFLETDSGYTGRLKATYYYGPLVTENDIVDLIRGKGLGEASNEISSKLKGNIAETPRIDASFPWVYRVPGDPNKITVKIEVEE